jgi:uncharacterized repeat protein (TIGR03803 family)
MKTLPTIALATIFGAMLPAPRAAAQTRFTTLYSFTGGFPAGLTAVNGTLYGVGAGGEGSCGTVFELQPPSIGGGAWTETLLYAFADSNDACFPEGGPVAGADGALYGLSAVGGAYDGGAMYELRPPASPGGSWTESVAFSFGAPDSGFGNPVTPLVDGPEGSFYTLTTYASGALVQLYPPAVPGLTWSGALLSVVGGAGIYLISGPHGELYGTTEQGGATQSGDVFRLAPPTAPGGAWADTVLHSFVCCYKGVSNPNALTLASDGTLYGAASGTSEDGEEGDGAVFALTPPASAGGPWAYTVLHNFGVVRAGRVSGGPDTQLVLRNGNLYGALATAEGGYVFELQPPSSPGGAWTTTYLHRFTNGQVPFGQLVVDQDGTLYGITGTIYGGPYSGTIYRIAPK